MKLKSEKGVHMITLISKRHYVIFTDLQSALRFIWKKL